MARQAFPEVSNKKSWKNQYFQDWLGGEGGTAFFHLFFWLETTGNVYLIIKDTYLDWLEVKKGNNLRKKWPKKQKNQRIPFFP